MFYQRWLHEFFQIHPTQFTIPIIGDVAPIHDLTEEITEVFPWDLGEIKQMFSTGGRHRPLYKPQ